MHLCCACVEIWDKCLDENCDTAPSENSAHFQYGERRLVDCMKLLWTSGEVFYVETLSVYTNDPFGNWNVKVAIPNTFPLGLYLFPPIKEHHCIDWWCLEPLWELWFRSVVKSAMFVWCLQIMPHLAWSPIFTKALGFFCPRMINVSETLTC